MKYTLTLIFLLAGFTASHAQLLDKLKNKAEKAAEKVADKVMSTDTELNNQAQIGVSNFLLRQ